LTSGGFRIVSDTLVLHVSMLYPEEINTINALNSMEKRASNLVYEVCDVYRQTPYISTFIFLLRTISIYLNTHFL